PGACFTVGIPDRVGFELDALVGGLGFPTAPELMHGLKEGERLALIVGGGIEDSHDLRGLAVDAFPKATFKDSGQDWIEALRRQQAMVFKLGVNVKRSEERRV